MAVRLSWSLASSSNEGLVDETKLCERLGLDGVWFPDYEPPFNSYNWPELYVTLSTLAVQTKRLFLGSLITDVLRRHPMVTVHAFTSLGHLAPNRVILGLGAGAGSSQQPYGIPVTHLARRLEEGIEVIRALCAARPEKPAGYSGKYFTLRKAGPPMKPPSKIPIYVAAYGPRMLSLTAKLADGWVPESHTPETYRDTLSRIHGEMKTVGRTPEMIEPCVALIFYPHEPDDASYSRILRAAKRYLAEYPDILWAADEGKGHPGVRTQELVADDELWTKLTDEVPARLADATLIYGDPEACTERLTEFVKAGCKHIILEPYWIQKEKLPSAILAASKIRAELVGR